MKKQTEREYGRELGQGIKDGMKGLNTMASPKKRKACALMIVIPFVLFVAFFAIGISTDNNNIASIGILCGLCMGIYQFYVGKFKKGLIYTVTIGFFCIGALADLFKLIVTKTFKDSNGFPLIY